jgi:hypothetical protein
VSAASRFLEKEVTMRRVYQGASWLFGSLTLALLVLGCLAVPTQKAFADSGDCGSQCSSFCAGYFTVGSDQYNQCVGSCIPICQSGTNCDPQCQGFCA